MILYWKVSLGEWKEEIISTLHLRSCIMGSLGWSEMAGNGAEPEPRPVSGQHSGGHVVCTDIVTSITSLLTY